MKKSGMRMVRAVLLAAAGMAVLAGQVSAATYEGNGEDFAQISQLLQAYSYTLDGKDPEGWAHVFTPNGVFRAAMFCLVGHDQLAALVSKQLAAQKPLAPGEERMGGHHVVDMGMIKYQDKNHATIHSFVMGAKDVARGATAPGMGVIGWYDDKLERIDGHWLIADRLEHSAGDGPPLPCPPPK